MSEPVKRKRATNFSEYEVAVLVDTVLSYIALGVDGLPSENDCDELELFILHILLVKQCLTNRFGERWTRRFDPIHPNPSAGSPDLSPLDVFLWDAVKQKIYSNDLPPNRENY
ncbi:hypothetical protein ABEB36_013315 [Hypothenemus hampei]|uniref:Uncharacterized protein n=1 Tax=Hypothenemus hampei TaxID=57062 RepID=A0ABD1E7L0_HYPHA